ncbi:MAG TPA: hypothetical protein DEH02_01635 [Bacteroidales bacterium]|nr:MAG: hypothetical protein A2X01_00975 [Bacteroidetes bacterium GWF2_35_48]OFY92909.1 MAG: hypothetical protein A2491_13425 [Bacteroidetes bacterium RIFOXYC12_FULL_35_7]HBX49751.1 hypothetical protein [Bacteroidales bacterium]
MKHFILIILTIFLFSCKKEDQNININITTETSGTLLVKVLDNNSTSISGAKVAIYSYVATSSSGSIINILANDSTNANGEYYAGKLLEGEYSVTVQVSNNNFQYREEIDFQIIAGDSKVIQVFPIKNVGNIKILVLNYVTESPYSNLKVSLLKNSYYMNSTPYDYLLSQALLTETTSNDGWVAFTNVPALQSYSVLFHYDSTHYLLNNYVSSNKESTKEYSFIISIP